MQLIRVAMLCHCCHHACKPWSHAPFTHECAGAGTIASIKFGPHKKECYVVLSSVDEAERVRDATFGIRWPPDNKDSSLRPK